MIRRHRRSLLAYDRSGAGSQTVDGAQDAKFASGRIALQHGLGLKDDKGIVKFRKVEIKPM
jgi:hypothetical protein